MVIFLQPERKASTLHDTSSDDGTVDYEDTMQLYSEDETELELPTSNPPHKEKLKNLKSNNIKGDCKIIQQELVHHFSTHNPL